MGATRHLMSYTLLKHSDGFDLVEVVQRGEFRILSEKDPALDEPWQPRAGLVSHMAGGGDGKDIVEFFESPLLRFCAN